MAITTINPATGGALRVYEEMTASEAAEVVSDTHEAFLDWRLTLFSERAALMIRAAEVLRANAGEYARMMAQEMGKPIRDGAAEIEKCAVTCEYFARNAERFLAPEPAASDALKSYVTFNPLGIVLAIMPWNFPFWQVFRFVAPNLMAGNAAILKHASNVTGCALAIEDVFCRAGFPKHLFRTLVIGSSKVEALIDHLLVRAVTVTGSVATGRAVATKAGAALKKTVLELGGSDAYIVLEDANLEFAAQLCANARLVNSGQSCIAAKRFLVPVDLCAEFERLLVARMGAAKVGDPLDQQTEIGPLARYDLRDALHLQIEASVAKGARCLLGGALPDGPGAYYPPTVLTEVNKGMPAFDEELFGPVAAVIPVTDEAEAIKLANDSIFGLGSCVITSDAARGEHIAAELMESGTAFVNGMVHSDPRLPFGGIKQSGYGRELSAYGLKEFVNAKTVCVYRHP
ncbi:NAD-dependent succinate-semialdehyde dehydrogenase (plasmid) [Methylocystis sp. MJC1]|jgi:succinate-semialdehyde dehydrogenase/glutarate-semialdehyde dehydrogenase|uniref:NAD-dependent succinate-semialdehyde dehydrogenase n=1 Tax=Methylocystis sp. MJC1 TaxID=2654282 RepID=UPI0013EE1215|nr:NAD-dependent succinate-semialdehyde dehydrogenase [Methylocystis sp. MJC1]KAF2991502.1 Aldehyde dehydrogenase [Methylocystis sp. MJC1]MBU6529185.1 NAD-dependent succinate-semialdehyde dehydrogenase [Methylocystis sp. MJC1]UZX13866.1 NAD-dependent succinate-semialdehyde dehydrogenase [Methylocystis sp. MJC1]